MLKIMFKNAVRAIVNPATTTRAWVRLITKRILRLAVAAALLLIIYNVWNIASLKSQQQLTEHTRQLAQLTLFQLEHQAIEYLLTQQEQSLASSVAHLQSHPSVISVVVRNPLGEVIVARGDYTSVIDWPAELTAEPWFMTRELRRQGESMGYLQVIFDQHQLLSKSSAAHDGLMQQGRVLLFLAMLAGVFIMLGFNRIRDRFWQRKNAVELARK